MGLQRNGDVGGKWNTYRRMDSEDEEEDSQLSNGEEQRRKQQMGVKINNGETTKFVFACAIFASLNSVLLGYGWYFLLS